MKVTLEARNKIEETQFSSCREENSWRAFECVLLIYSRKQKSPKVVKTTESYIFI